MSMNAPDVRKKYRKKDDTTYKVDKRLFRLVPKKYTKCCLWSCIFNSCYFPLYACQLW